MWKYVHTDEMYHSLTNRNNSDVLYHSDVYLGQDFSDGIKHWKYIKREKVNGKWRYYYKDDKLADLQYKKDRDTKALLYENKKRGYDDGTKPYGYSRVKGKDVTDPTYTKLASDAFVSTTLHGIEKRRSDKRKKKYNPTVKGLNALSDASYAVGKQVRKGKKAIKKAFSKKKKKK